MSRWSSNFSFLVSSRWLALSLLGGALACSVRPAEFETTSALPDLPRRPPGVAVDPAPSIPDATEKGETFDGLLVLEAPPDPRAARTVVREFFAAVTREAADKLDELVSPSAWVDSGSQRQPVRAFWRSRFSQLDYSSLAGEVLYRESELSFHRPRDIARLSGARPTFVDAEPTDVVVRVPIRASWRGRTRLLGDEFFFLLRPSDDRFVIAEIIEDFRLP